MSVRRTAFWGLSILAIWPMIAAAAEEPREPGEYMPKFGCKVYGLESRERNVTIAWVPLLVDRQSRGRLYMGKRWVRKEDIVPLLEAEAYYNQLLSQDPRNAWGYTMRGSLYGRLGKPERATADLAKAIELDPQGNDGYLGQVMLLDDAGKLAETIALLDRILARDPRCADAIGYRAEVRLDEGQLETSLADADRAIQLDAEDDRSFWTRGRVLHAKGDTDAALKAFDEAVRIQPSAPEYYVSRGLLWLDKDELDKALGEASDAIRVNRQHADAYVLRGHIYRLKGDAGSAVRDLDAALAITPELTTALRERLLVSNMAGDKERVLADAEQLLTLEPQAADVYSLRAEVLLELNEGAKAIADLTEVVRLQPNEPMAYWQRGVAYFRATAEHDRTLADFTEAIRRNVPAPYLQQCYTLRAITWVAKDEPAKAIADYQEAERLDPREPGSLMNHAWLLATYPDAKFRNGREAVRLAERAYQLLKEAHMADALAAAHAENGDFAAAVKYETEALTLGKEDAKFRQEAGERLSLYKQDQPFRERVKAENR